MRPASNLLMAVVFVTTLLFGVRVSAQTTPAKSFVFSIGPGIGIPTGNAHNYSTFTLGGTGRFQYGITDNFAVTFTTGGDHFFSKIIPGTDKRYGSYGLIPLKAGVKVFFIPNIYAGIEAGEGFEVLPHTLFKGGQKKFIISPALGYANTHWDYGIRFDSATGQQNNYGILALRIAYGFKL